MQSVETICVWVHHQNGKICSYKRHVCLEGVNGLGDRDRQTDMG